ncbi:hypothetical protein VTN49DRAFT_4868 [Thermomyces lanuginosus]|uniref:uncharacterized protein n=1 Tax=Thermomyces lanuginosus TaxID=5541 RepID=UPI003744956A
MLQAPFKGTEQAPSDRHRNHPSGFLATYNSPVPSTFESSSHGSLLLRQPHSQSLHGVLGIIVTSPLELHPPR